MSGRGRHRFRTVVALVTAAMVAAGCAPPERRGLEIRLWTDDFAIRVTSDPMPPRALERVQYTVAVRDKETGQPIAGGQGRIFATSRDRRSIANGFEEGPEVGTYRTTLLFVTAGDWAMGIQFRRDSTQALQQTNDWMQEVRPAAELGQD